MTTRRPYAWVCSTCEHHATKHRLVKGGELVAGPYACSECDCQIRQDSSMYGVDKNGARVL